MEEVIVGERYRNSSLLADLGRIRIERAGDGAAPASRMFDLLLRLPEIANVTYRLNTSDSTTLLHALQNRYQELYVPENRLIPPQRTSLGRLNTVTVLSLTGTTSPSSAVASTTPGGPPPPTPPSSSE